jgi:hypothetical protein
MCYVVSYLSQIIAVSPQIFQDWMSVMSLPSYSKSGVLPTTAGVSPFQPLLIEDTLGVLHWQSMKRLVAIEVENPYDVA